MSTTPDEVPVTRLWLGQTGPERADERRGKLIEAGFELLAAQGAAAVAVRAVTRESGLSPKYFYESFADRDQLLAAVFDHAFQGIKRAVDEAMSEAAADFASQARASIDATARCLEEDPRLGRVLLRETLADETLRRLAEQQLPEFVLAVALRAARPDSLVAAEPADLQVAVLAISGVQVSLMLAWSEGQISLSREQFVEKVLGVITAIAAPFLS